jgi:hypothetical protein
MIDEAQHEVTQVSNFRPGLALAAVLTLILTSTVGAASSPKLHPSGFGEHSYASWKGGEGLQDSTGNKDQALYLQKDTSTATVAAGVAVFRGVEGMQTSELLPLEFWVRTDSHCGAGAPRFNVRVQPAVGPQQTVFVGCAAMAPGATAPTDDGHVYQQRTFIGPLPAGTVTGLAIVFDEGDDLGTAFPCPNDTPTDPNSCVYLDNIRVGDHVWTSASDNGGGNTVDAAALEAMWGAPLETLLRN